MQPTAPLDVEIIRRSTRDEAFDHRRLRKAVSDGSWRRIATGAYIKTSEWAALTPIERHRIRVQEVTRRLHAPVVISHWSAAALHGIDVLGAWPRTVDVSCAPARGGRSSGAIRRHPRSLDALDLVTEARALDACGPHVVTSPAQTALDLARIEPFLRGVSLIDQAIWASRRGGPLTDIEGIMHIIESSGAHRGNARARRALTFADALAANVRESQSRVVIARLGFPRPRLQERRVLRSGRLVFGDFYWPDHDHWGELDGESKYLHAGFLKGRTAAEAVIDEKNRENEIRREVRGFSRWGVGDADHPRRLYDILTRAGLPSALPRP